MMRVSVKTAALSLGALLGLTYILCVAWDLAVPEGLRMYASWSSWLPGFRWLDPGSFLLGLVEVGLYGVYAGGAFAIIYNAVSGRTAS